MSRVYLGILWDILEQFGGYFGTFWGIFGVFWGIFGGIVAQFLGCIGIIGIFWDIWGLTLC